MIVTPFSGPSNCGNSGNSRITCSSSDPQGFTSANSIANASAGFVSVELNGGATLYGSFAAATSRASNSGSYLFTDGSGTGTLNYSVALSGFANGNPFEPASVLFNGSSYSVLPYATPTYYSFTRNFTYGQPFLLTLSLEMFSNWDGSRGDGSSRFASARLASMNVVDNFAVGGAASSAVPEPGTATMWIGGALLILVGMRKKPKQR